MTLFQPLSGSSLFSLPSLIPQDDSSPFKSSIPSLKTVEKGFGLPGLDEYAAGEDRMLRGLEEGSWWNLRVGNEDVKGKGRSIGDTHAPTSPDDERDVQQNVATDWGVMAEHMGMEAEAGPSQPRAFKKLPTWNSEDETINPFVSEAGPAMFEAINLISEPQLSFPKLRSRPNVVPANSEALLQLLIHATMGTTTTDDLQWDIKRSVYSWAGGQGRIEGLSRLSSAAAVQDFLDISTSLRRLDQMIDQQSKSPLTPTHHALYHAVSTYLSFIKDRLAAAIADSEVESTLGWIKWKASLKDVGELLRLLVEIMGWPLSESQPIPLPSKSSSLLTHLYSNLLAQYQTCSLESNMPVLCLAYLLQASSAPFLKLLHAWIGLSTSPAEISNEDQPWVDLGITRIPRRTTGRGTSEDDLWDYDFSAKRMPAFIPKDTRRKLFEAGKSLRLLREANADHPLGGGEWGLEGGWGWGAPFIDVHSEVNAHIKRISRDTGTWRRSFRDRPLSGSSSAPRLRPIRKERKGLPMQFYQPDTSQIANDPPATLNLEKDFTELLDILRLPPGRAAKSTSLWSSTPLDSLHSFLAFHSTHPILPDSYPTFPLYISHHLLAPLLAHADLVSAALVSLYIDELKFTDHLDILHSFWLGGDVGFFERVSTALFGRDDQEVGGGMNMGRRARTRARMGLGATGTGTEERGEWGIALGVGLSDRQRWPPGGAELAYALRTTLLDDTEVSKDGSAWEEVEDRVSFAIRPLPEGVDGIRAKWMDPQAIEALDFLYLSCTPPPSISVVLPRDILAKYQLIHNFLLRICRVNAVARSMFSDLHKPRSDTSYNDLKSGVDQPRPRSNQSQTRRTIISSVPQVEKTISHLRFRMSHFISATMRYMVDSAIGLNFARMRKRLDKLKRSESDIRSPTPIGDGYSEFDDVLEYDEDVDEVAVLQLKSIHSLVAYHHITLDRIMRATLLSPSAGYDVTYKLLMRLFGLILDLGKIVKEVEGGMVDLSEGKDRVMAIKEDWDEKERVFMLALDRLSQKSKKRDESGDGEREDVDILLDDADDDGRGSSGKGGLAELLIRLKMGMSKWRTLVVIFASCLRPIMTMLLDPNEELSTGDLDPASRLWAISDIAPKVRRGNSLIDARLAAQIIRSTSKARLLDGRALDQGYRI